MTTNRTTPLANLSSEHRAHAVRLLRGKDVLNRTDLSDGAKLMFAVTLLVCDDHGRAVETDVSRAMDDPSIINAARQIMAEAAS